MFFSIAGFTFDRSIGCRCYRRRCCSILTSPIAFSTRSIFNTFLTRAAETRTDWTSIMYLSTIFCTSDVWFAIWRLWICYQRFWRITAIIILWRAKFTTSLPRPIADLKGSVVMQPFLRIIFPHQGTLLLGSFTQETFIELGAVAFMRDVGCCIFRIYIWIWAFPKNIVLRFCLLNRWLICSAHAPRCQKGDGDYVYPCIE